MNATRNSPSLTHYSSSAWTIRFRLFFVACLASVGGMGLQAADQPLWADSSRPADERIEEIIKQLTLEEKAMICTGRGLVEAPHRMQLMGGAPRLGLEPFGVLDGPRGVGARVLTVMPSGLGLGSTWDPSIVEEVGAVLGNEARASHITISLGPAFNLNRDVLGGRFFEYFSDDPLLSGKLAAAQIRGLQSEGVGACAKHYAVNGREFNRNDYMSRADERTLRELYLKNFEIAVKEGKPWSVMTAANGLNGDLCSDSQFLLNDMLKGEWGFEGLVMTDWCHSKSTVKAALAGLDVDMPGGKFEVMKFGQPLVDAVKRGDVPESVVDDKVRRVLRVYALTGLLDGKDRLAGAALNTPEHREVALRAAQDGAVLLRNENNLLPFDLAKLRKVIATGPNLEKFFCQDGLGGSSGAQAFQEVTPLMGLREVLGDKLEVVPLSGNAEFEVIPSSAWKTLAVTFHELGEEKTGIPNVRKPVRSIDMNLATNKMAPQFDAIDYRAVFQGKLVAPVTGKYVLRLVSDGPALVKVGAKGGPATRNSENGTPQNSTAILNFEAGQEYVIAAWVQQTIWGRKNIQEMNYWAKDHPSIRLEWALPASSEEIAKTLAPHRTAFEAADAVIFVGGGDHSGDSEGRDRSEMGFPSGQSDLIQQIAAINPKTAVVLYHGSPMELPWLESVPAVLDMFYPGTLGGTAMANLLFGKGNPSGKLPFSWPKKLEDSPAYKLAKQDKDNIHFDEGLMLGYRYFDTMKADQHFAFGHGLSYTKFDYSDMKAACKGDACQVTLKLTNSGAKDGAEVVQIYVAQKNPKIPRPVHELRAFEKVALKAGESKTVTFDLGPDAFSYWDPATKAWTSDADEFVIEAASSSRDIRQTATVQWAGTPAAK
jgi:beta-glucosidase